MYIPEASFVPKKSARFFLADYSFSARFICSKKSARAKFLVQHACMVLIPYVIPCIPQSLKDFLFHRNHFFFCHKRRE